MNWWWWALTRLLGVISLTLLCGRANADGPAASPPSDPLTILVCRDRQDPGIGGTLVLDLGRRRLVQSTNEGPTILFGDRNVPLVVTPAAIEWEVAHNTYVLNRATLELDVIGRIYVCQIAPRQL
jgi:hypothetical protein